MLNAAAMAESNGMPADAVCLYGLGSSFVDVLRVLNDQLAMVLVPPHPARDEWKALAAEFFEKHLSSGQTYVQAQLMKSGGGEIIGSTFQVESSDECVFLFYYYVTLAVCLGYFVNPALYPSDFAQPWSFL